MILQLLLVLHLTGFTMMVGPYLITDKPRVLTILEGVSGLPALIGIGAMLLLSTGIGMVILFKGAITGMLWFRIKMILVLLILVNGALIPRRSTAKLKILLTKTGESDRPIVLIGNRMGIFHATQLLLFFIIFVLSVFRF